MCDRKEVNLGELVTIVVSIYNAEETLEKCITSIMNQSYVNMEIILVNDGSSDYSKHICADYALNDNRIRIINKKNGGLTSARKAGFDIARGKYICFVDSDDYLHEKYVEKHIRNIIDTKADLSIVGYSLLGYKNSVKPVQLVHSQKIYSQDEIVTHFILPGICKLNTDETRIPDFLWMRMFKKELINEECFVSEREVYTEDTFFNLEYYKRCCCIAIVDDWLYFYYQNPMSLTHIYRKNKLCMEMNRIKLLEKKLTELGIEDKDRIKTCKVKAFFECINNASYTEQYKEFKRNLKEVKNSRQIIAGLREIRINELSLGEKLTYLFFKCKLYKLLYLLKKYQNRVKG